MLATVNKMQVEKLIDDVSKLHLRMPEDETKRSSFNSYLASYEHLLRYFRNIREFGVGELVCGAHMIYGWMPTVLTIGIHYKDGDILGQPVSTTDLIDGARILKKARDLGKLESDDLGKIRNLVNHSCVGASKLLHFVAPDKFAIWDSKVCAYVFKREEGVLVSRPGQSSVNDLDRLIQYQDLVKQVAQDKRFNSAFGRVRGKLGYEITALRAAELLMFSNAPKFKKSKKSSSD